VDEPEHHTATNLAREEKVEGGSATAMVGLRLQRAHGGGGKKKGKVAMMDEGWRRKQRENKEGKIPEMSVNDD
jgi:hypothetical protein